MEFRDLIIENDLMNEMDEEKFWKFIEYTKKITSRKEDQIELIINILSERRMNEIVKFEVIKSYYHEVSYTSKLWAVAYYLNHGCSDDSFSNYRGWLISEGKTKYEILTSDIEKISDSFTSKNEINGFSERFLFVATYALDKKYPEDSDKQIDLEEMSDMEYNNRYNPIFPFTEFEWEGRIGIEKLYPKFTSTFK